MLLGEMPGPAAVLGDVSRCAATAWRPDKSGDVALDVTHNGDRRAGREQRAVPVLAAIVGRVDDLTAAPSEDRLAADGADERNGERCLRGVEVQRRPVGLPRLAAVGGCDRI